MTASQTFHDHVQELRRRILWIVLSIGVSAGVAYTARMPLVRILQHPLGAPLFYSSPAGSFNFVLKLAMMIGMFIALPVMIYHLLRFIEPALPVVITRSSMVKVIGSSFILALMGIAFGFFYMIPMSLHFFGEFSSAQIKPLISAGEYLSYVTNNLMIFALIFQIPLVVLFINWIKPVRPSRLLRYQRHVIVGSFGVALVLPFTYDPISQFIVAVPIVVLFYLSAVLLWLANRKRDYAEEVPEVSLLPALEPTIGRTPALLPVITPALSASRSYTMDGFVGRPKRSLAPTPEPVQISEPQQRVLEGKQDHQSIPRPKLTIDGISPPLPSFF